MKWNYFPSKLAVFQWVIFLFSFIHLFIWFFIALCLCFLFVSAAFLMWTIIFRSLSSPADNSGVKDGQNEWINKCVLQPCNFWQFLLYKVLHAFTNRKMFLSTVAHKHHRQFDTRRQTTNRIDYADLCFAVQQLDRRPTFTVWSRTKKLAVV